MLKQPIENKDGTAVVWSKAERRLQDLMGDTEAMLAKSRAPDQAAFEEMLDDLDKALIICRQELFIASARGDGAACAAKGRLQNEANAVRSRLIASQGKGTVNYTM